MSGRAKITVQPSSTRTHHQLPWLTTYQSFNPDKEPPYNRFGSLTAIGEDVVQPQSGFPTHHHQNFEIFTYVLSGELTHRDSRLTQAKAEQDGDRSKDFYRMRRNDVQLTTTGSGISHSEINEHVSEAVHLLQIWVAPWKLGLTPAYRNLSFSEDKKRLNFLKFISPFKSGIPATIEHEGDSKPAEPETLPIHADFVAAAGIIAPGREFHWAMGGRVTTDNARKVYVHLPMTRNGEANVRLCVNGVSTVELSEGDGAFIEHVTKDDELTVKNIGLLDTEVLVLDGAATFGVTEQ
ncbi:unnamed protein product [Clonostachys byssicola]|uniref:Pirin N-terminal domain-containing protein n=1 Tax=Clonostachys byssicola TaxID=160290 RepID=A0A9N9UAX6_9HYPO|nr:unnamed protein product [Clonostachys byssicola]